MEEVKFRVKRSDLLYYVDDENKLTLFILNSDRNKVRSIDQFVARKGGEEVRFFDYQKLKDQEAAIRDEYREKITNIKENLPLFGKRKALKLKEIEELKQERETKIEQMWQDGYSQFPGVEDMGPSNRYFIVRGNDFYLLNYVDALAYSSELHYSYDSEEELKNFEKHLQERLLEELTEEKINKNTDEYMNF